MPRRRGRGGNGRTGRRRRGDAPLVATPLSQYLRELLDRDRGVRAAGDYVNLVAARYLQRKDRRDAPRVRTVLAALELDRRLETLRHTCQHRGRPRVKPGGIRNDDGRRGDVAPFALPRPRGVAFALRLGGAYV